MTAHAEMLAFTAASGYLSGKYLVDCTLYVTLEPCPMCAGALYWTQISKLVYGASDNKRGYRKIAKDMLHPKTIVVGEILENECQHLLNSFFTNKRQ